MSSERVSRRVHLSAKLTDGTDMVPYVDADELLAAVVGLFAEVPGLAKQLLKLSERNTAGVEVASLFDHIFEIPSGPTLRADHKFVVHYRLRNVDQSDLASGASDSNLSDFDGHKIAPALLLTSEKIQAIQDCIAKHAECEHCGPGLAGATASVITDELLNLLSSWEVVELGDHV